MTTLSTYILTKILNGFYLFLHICKIIFETHHRYVLLFVIFKIDHGQFMSVKIFDWLLMKKPV